MRGPTLLVIAVVLLRGAAWAQPPASAAVTAPEVVVEVRVHGNHTTPDAEVLRIAGVTAGQPVTAQLFDEIGDRLRQTDRFHQVQVLKRFASLTDASRIVVVIVVEERAGVSIDVPSPGPLRRWKASTMWMPVLGYEDGYGFTYGARLSFIDLLGERTRISTPITWGGERRAAVEWERTFSRGPFTRVLATAGILQRENPAYDTADRRESVTLRLEHAFTPSVRVGAVFARERVHFDEALDRGGSAGLDVTLDTRGDPAFPRNAVYASLGLERAWFEHHSDTMRTRSDLRGYVGLVGQTVLVLRGQHLWAADALPSFERALLGGNASLRGRRLGYRHGDQLAAASAEIRVPISSPLRAGRVGVAVFVDTGTVSAHDRRLRDARFDTGIGAGLFVGAAVFNARLDVARAIGAGTRATFGLGLTF